MALTGKVKKYLAKRLKEVRDMKMQEIERKYVIVWLSKGHKIEAINSGAAPRIFPVVSVSVSGSLLPDELYDFTAIEEEYKKRADIVKEERQAARYKVAVKYREALVNIYLGESDAALKILKDLEALEL